VIDIQRVECRSLYFFDAITVKGLPMKFGGKSSTRITGDFMNQSRYFASIIILIISILFVPGAGKLAGNSEVTLAASNPVIAAAGDIACDPTSSNFNSGNGSSGLCRQQYTSDLLVNTGLAAVLPLGDVQYYCGSYQAFLQSYDLSWGRVRSISHPVIGNHEYITSADPNGPSSGCDVTNESAAGYFNYFGAAAGNKGQGYYSYDIGTWHLIALNSNCTDVGGCTATSAQGQWLEADLSAHSNFCTLAYWHIPLFSSGGRGELNSKGLWQILYNHDADLILNGHDHIYERFAPQDPNGIADIAKGMREFIVGSGGANHTSFDTIAANSEVRNADTYGVLKLTLHSTSYNWKFVPEAGKTFTDSGTGACHGSSSDTTQPTAPSNLTASAVTWNQVSLNWTAGTDNVGVVGYQVFRNGIQIASSSSTSYVDTTTRAQTKYSYSVKAVDGVGLTSNLSNTATVTTPNPASILIFTPTSDTYVQSDTPATNYGSSTQLVVDNSPIRNAFLRFNVSGIGTRRVTSAKLRIYCVDPSSLGGVFYRVANTTWSENGINWDTAPTATASKLASLGKVSADRWYEVDITSFVTGDGTYSLKMSSTSSDEALYLSKEGATPGFAPQLILSLGSSIPTATPAYASGTIFADVPTNYWARAYIERLYAAGITGGCGSSPLRYCPTSPVTRAQMAIFLLRAEHGSGYTPPTASGTVFGDVPATYWAGAWIERLAAEGITGGCGSGMYCPEGIVSRDQMAIFLLRAEHGSGYVPPVGSGSLFVDVPASYWAGAWIEQLVGEGIAAGCGSGTFCPTTSVSRDQMAVFLVRAFHLP
jgi:calcineurin-like phosphoesterase family protein/fibronectin type III domain protein/S-layer family protein